MFYKETLTNFSWHFPFLKSELRGLDIHVADVRDYNEIRQHSLETLGGYFGIDFRFHFRKKMFLASITLYVAFILTFPTVNRSISSINPVR
jgi:hypothetical protein